MQNRLTRQAIAAGLALAGLALAAAPLAAQTQSYPAKPVRVVVPLAPGGGSDIVARIAAQALSDAWGVSPEVIGKTVWVEKRLER